VPPNPNELTPRGALALREGRNQLVGDHERATRKVDERIGRLVVQRWRDRFVVQNQRGLDEADNPAALVGCPMFPLMEPM